MIQIEPTEAFAIARAERARRKASWQGAGKGGSEQASHDDILWSNIEHVAGCWAGDAPCLARRGIYYGHHHFDMMERSARATALKADEALDKSIAANARKVRDLWALYFWMRERNPTPGPPEYMRAEQAKAAA